MFVQLISHMTADKYASPHPNLLLPITLMYEPKIFFFSLVHLNYAVYKFQCWDCIGLEVGLCTKDCFEAESSTLLHVELCMHFVSFLCNYFWEIFSYTVCML